MDIQITVASTTPGGADKKTSKITDTTGKTWYVYNNVFAQFMVGNSYLITKHKTSDFKGTTYYYVDAFTPIAGGGQVRGGPNGGYTTATTPQVSPVPDGYGSAKIDNERRMDIFICGAFNNMMANPNVHPIELDIPTLAALVNGLRQVWLSTLGPSRPSPISTSTARMENAPPPVRPLDDMNESIPF